MDVLLETINEMKDKPCPCWLLDEPCARCKKREEERQYLIKRYGGAKKAHKDLLKVKKWARSLR